MKIHDIELLLNANRILASTLDIDHLLQVVLKLAAQVVQAETGSLLLLDEKSNELVFNVALGAAGKELKTIRLKMGEGIAGWVAKENKPLIVNDPANDPRWTKRGDQKTKFVTRSILCVPMVHQKKLLGVVQAINRKDANGFSHDDQKVLEAFAAQTAVALQNARLFSSVRAEKEKIETIVSQMTDGAIFSNENGEIVLANPAAIKLLGISEKNISKNKVWDLLKSFEISPPLDVLTKAYLTQFDAERNSGKKLILTGMVKKILSEKKELIGHLTVFRDVTLEKKEEKLKRDFLSLMSHKLKTPLVAITGYTPMLMEEEELEKANPFIKSAIKSIHEQGIHLKQLVEKLITFSLIEAEEMEIQKKPHVVKDLLKEILGGMRTFLESKKARVVIDPSIDKLPKVNVDFDKFREMMKSLIENAAKFNTKDRKNIKIKGNSKNRRVTLSVADNGRGIPSEEFDKIFQKFYQIEESFTGQVEGAGLGLALVKRLVESHDGLVRLESKVGKGSIFHIEFPIKG